MAIETVDQSLQKEHEDHYKGLDCDIGSGKLHHDMNPKENYIQVEFKFPAIKKHMPEEDHDRIEETYHHECMHQVKYLKVDNNTFHAFMNNEGKVINKDNRSNGEVTNQYYSYQEREGIDVIRDILPDRTISFYHSNQRTLGLLRHDYYMGLLLYANWPQREFMRRTPCNDLDPKCKKCPEFLAMIVEGWKDDAEPYRATIEKTFFTYIEENHRLCMGYTVDVIPSLANCYEPPEVEYYIMDMEVQYFREAEYSEKKWNDKIMHNRKTNNQEMYSLGGPIKNPDEIDLPYLRDKWKDYGNGLPCVVYNPTHRDTCPVDIWAAMSSGDLVDLWYADSIRFNARSTAHKWTFNSWWTFGRHHKNGWYCGVNPSELISEGTSSITGGKEVAQQLTQVGNMFGWTQEGGSTDSEFTFVKPKLEGYTYKKIDEPLPIRDLE